MLLAAGLMIGVYRLIVKKNDMLTVLAPSLIAGSILFTIIVNYGLNLYDISQYHYSSWLGSSRDRRASFLCMLPDITAMAAWILMADVCYKYIRGYRLEAQKHWFMPAVIRLIKLPLQIIIFLWFSLFSDWTGGPLLLSGILTTLLSGGILLFYSHQLIGKAEENEEDAFYQNGYCGIIKHLLLSAFTLGIWQLVWMYRTTRYLNQVEGYESMKPSTQVIAGLFVPFYLTYWIYKNSLKLDALSRKQGYTFKLTLPCLALKFLSPLNIILPSMLMQERINAIAKGRQKGSCHQDRGDQSRSASGALMPWKKDIRY